jgi:hypothetical protein
MHSGRACPPVYHAGHAGTHCCARACRGGGALKPHPERLAWEGAGGYLATPAAGVPLRDTLGRFCRGEGVLSPRKIGLGEGVGGYLAGGGAGVGGGPGV